MAILNEKFEILFLHNILKFSVIFFKKNVTFEKNLFIVMFFQKTRKIQKKVLHLYAITVQPPINTSWRHFQQLPYDEFPYSFVVSAEWLMNVENCMIFKIFFWLRTNPIFKALSVLNKFIVCRWKTKQKKDANEISQSMKVCSKLVSQVVVLESL